MESAEKMLKELGVRAKKASRELNRLGVKRKNEGLERRELLPTADIMPVLVTGLTISQLLII